MTLDAFEASLAGTTPPLGLAPLVEALWHERLGHWARAHEIVQEIDSADAAWVHAHLHRREGDQSNAAYWYRHAGKPVARGALDEEWRAIVTALLGA